MNCKARCIFLFIAGGFVLFLTGCNVRSSTTHVPSEVGQVIDLTQTQWQFDRQVNDLTYETANARSIDSRDD